MTFFLAEKMSWGMSPKYVSGTSTHQIGMFGVCKGSKGVSTWKRCHLLTAFFETAYRSGGMSGVCPGYVRGDSDRTTNPITTCMVEITTEL